MGSTYASLHLHLVFATKDRQPTIAQIWRNDLHAYLGGTLRSLDVVPEAIGGTEDHVHILGGFRTTHRPADVVRELKKASTQWVRQAMGFQGFSWQEGYAVLSVSAEGSPAVRTYIENQEAHHRKYSALEELEALLKKEGIEFDPIYLS